MAHINLKMDDGREIGFGGFDDKALESLFRALQYYQVINNSKPAVYTTCCDPLQGPLGVIVNGSSNTVPHIQQAVAQITFVVLPTK